MNRFFRFIVLVCSLMAVSLLSACSQPDSETAAPDMEQEIVEPEAVPLPVKEEEPEQLPGLSLSEEELAANLPALRIYKSVLQGEASFTAYGEELKISQLNRAVSADDSVTVEASQFAVLDLDGDGTVEVVLRLTVNEDEYFGFEILHYQDDIVYGYTQWYRGFQDLKADGSFFFSSGAADNGWGSLQFDGETITTIRKAESQSSYDDQLNFSIEFFVDGESTTERDYFSAMWAFGIKPDARWYDFTSENLDEIFPA